MLPAECERSKLTGIGRERPRSEASSFAARGPVRLFPIVDPQCKNSPVLRALDTYTEVMADVPTANLFR